MKTKHYALVTVAALPPVYKWLYTTDDGTIKYLVKIISSVDNTYFRMATVAAKFGGDDTISTNTADDLGLCHPEEQPLAVAGRSFSELLEDQILETARMTSPVSSKVEKV